MNPWAGAALAAAAAALLAPGAVALRRLLARARLGLFFETCPDTMAITDLESGRYLVVNGAFTRITGWTRQDAIGRPANDLVFRGLPGERDKLVQALRGSGRVVNLELRFRFKDGTVGAGLMSAQVVQMGGRSCIFSATRDISALRRVEAERAGLQEALVQAQRMEALGRLAGGVAHDFNNLLTVIKVNANLGLVEPEAGESQLHLREIGDAAERASGLTRQLLALARRQPMAERPLDLSEVVRAMRPLLQRLLPEPVELAFGLAEGLPPVLADRTQLEQVVVNLVVNARDAVQGRGRISVSTRAARVEPGAPERAPGGYGVVEVADDGPGMAPEVAARIFEPFFTTKGHGTGLGLATVYGVARQLGGFVEVRTAPGEGAAFAVHLREASGEPANAPVAAGSGLDRALRGGTETVLLVEDDDHVRLSTGQALARLGYTVLEAGSGSQALERSARFPGPIHLLLTDVIMGSMNGRELAARLSVQRPGLAVVYASGYSLEVLEEAGVVRPGAVLLTKPYGPAELAVALRRALQEQA